MTQKVVDTHIHYWDPDLLSYPWLESVPDIAARHGPRNCRRRKRRPSALNWTRLSLCRPEALMSMLFAKPSGWMSWPAPWTPDSRDRRRRSGRQGRRGGGRLGGLAGHSPCERRASPDSGPAQRLRRQPGLHRRSQAIGGVRVYLRHLHPSFQLGEAIRLVRACSAVNFVLDHVAKPDIKGQVFEPWKSQLQSLGALPNVVCKISGMVTEADQESGLPPTCSLTWITSLSALASTACCRGDWPVSLRAARSWGHWVDTLGDLAYWLSDRERHKLFYANAQRVYRV